MRGVDRGLSLITIAALAACATLSVNTIHDPDASFTGYRTFAFMEGGAAAVGPTGVDNPIVGREIEEAIRAELETRGMSEGTTPDFRVAFHAAVEEGFETASLTSYYGYRRSGLWVTETELREYSEGTLIIDFVDAGSNELAWRGTAEARVSDLQAPARRQETIRDAVREILSRFPPEM